MPEMKRSFVKAKMNKDVDERTLPPGEYRDALNVQVATSDTGDSGALQNIMGNAKVTNVVQGGSYVSASGDTCVGMVKNTSTDKIYYFISSLNLEGSVSKDYILEYDTINGKLRYVFVDIWRVAITPGVINDVAAISVTGNKAIRKGMKLGSDTSITVTHATPTSITLSSGITTTTGQEIFFVSERVLEFPTTGLVTGINILDDTLFWTDNATEPKRVNITKSFKGTGGQTSYPAFRPGSSIYRQVFNGDTPDFHTRFVKDNSDVPGGLEVLIDEGNGSESNFQVEYVKRSDITVIRKAPTQALNVEMSTTIIPRQGDTEGIISGAVIWNGSHPVGETITGLEFNNPMSFLEDDIVLFSVIGGGAGSNGEYDVMARVISSNVENPDSDPQSTGFKFLVLSISAELDSSFNDWRVDLDEGQAVLEDKFVRFSYRYKYQDGEYSTFAPWSEIAFLPGEYNYFAQEGYNKGMSNSLHNIKLKNYVPADVPLGVAEIDLLYKETNNPTVYTVKTVEPTDTTYVLETDLVHAVVPSNQLIRPWDNVPRQALAQEVSANRIIYGNYLQNYTVEKDPEIRSRINSVPVDLLENGVSSIKSLREYQIGVVFSDEYGRETPVLTNEKAAVKVPMLSSSRSNSLSVNIDSSTPVPTWATHYSFYIKEPTTEYYTLAMDRWYLAADGNIWLSFPSSERNKIDDETFLYLKKAHGTDIAVTSGQKYKILSIKNEAPDYIKTKYVYLQAVTNTPGSNTNVGSSSGGYPLVGQNKISVDTSLLTHLNPSKSIRVRFKNTADLESDSGESQFYTVDKVSPEGEKTVFHIHGELTTDVAWSTSEGDNFGTWEGRIDTLQMEIHEGEPKNLPEFDGRFFVKVLQSLEVTDLITSFSNDNTSFKVSDQWEVSYANNSAYKIPEANEALSENNLAVLKTAAHFESNAYDGVHPTEHSSHFHAQSGQSAYGWDATTTGLSITGDPIEKLNGADGAAFWESMRGKFFIDRCSAYSWSGYSGDLPGSIEDNVEYWASSDSVSAEAFMLEKFPGTNNSVHRWIIGNLMTNSGYLTPINDSDQYGNNDVTNNYGYGIGGFGIPSKGMWNDGYWGFMDISYNGYNSSNRLGPADGWDYPGDANVGVVQSASIIGPQSNSFIKVRTIDTDANSANEANFMEKLRITGTKFRFSKDPDRTIYTVNPWLPLFESGGTSLYDGAYYMTKEPEGEGGRVYSGGAFNAFAIGDTTVNGNEIDDFYLQGHYGIRNHYTSDNEGQWDTFTNARQKWTIKVSPEFGSGPHGYTPITGTQAPYGAPGLQPVRALHHDGTDSDIIQILTPVLTDESGSDISGGFVRNPAVWETKPKEAADVDIYYQASDIIPLRVSDATSQEFAPNGTTFVIGSNTFTINSWDKQTATLGSNLSTSPTGLDVVFTTPNGRKTTVSITGASGQSTISVPENVSFSKHELTWGNCWSFGNGVESDRIRDDFNAQQVDNGVKASTVIAGQLKEERRGSGVIWSGIYNSTSGVNDTNQFIAGESITKDLNPSYGSIQRLLTRDNTLVMFCEDKVLRAVTNKDALYSATGQQQIIASNAVVGDDTPYVGDWGISKNPESLAVSAHGAYFTDINRGFVLALLGNGISAISAIGMDNHFSNLKDLSANSYIVGTFDDRKKEYNLTTIKNSSETVSFSEKGRGWVSFKSFIPQAGISLNNEYYTFKDGDLWKHHVDKNEDGTVVNRNSFYGYPYESSVTTVFADTGGGVKSFNTIKYEGSKGRVTAFVDSNASILTGDYSVNLGLDTNETTYDGEYFNLSAQNGWYMESMKTDLQESGESEFKDKEGKWFSTLTGKTSSTVDTSEFLTQGLGLASATHSGTAPETVTVSVKNSSGAPWD